MNRTKAKILFVPFLLVVVLCSVSCDEIEDDIVEVGLLQIHPVQPAQTVPVLGEDSIQQAVWTIPAASVQFPEIAHDLTLSDDCIFSQSYAYDSSLSIGDGDCMLGAAVEVSPSALTGVLSITARLELSRVQQVDVSPGGDFDDDGVLNEEDNCPLIPNLEQEAVVDAFGDEIGIACAYDATGGTGEPIYFMDNELDGVPDVADNCPYHSNPDQLNEEMEGFPLDGIGDACTETATALASGQDTFSMDIDIAPYVQERRRMLLVVDFGKDLSGLNCDWIAGTCDLDPASIRACVLNDRYEATGGCP